VSPIMFLFRIGSLPDSLRVRYGKVASWNLFELVV
jgi:hypothetical protein